MTIKSLYPSAATATKIASNSQYIQEAVGFGAENPNDNEESWYAASSVQAGTAYATYSFDFSSIPNNATINKVTAKICGLAENQTYQYTSGGKYSQWQAFEGDTAKGEAVYTTQTSATIVELTNTGTWTRSSLNNLVIRHSVGYYGGCTKGITLQVDYGSGILHNVSIKLGSGVTVDKSLLLNAVAEGTDFDINTTSGSITSITDNGVNVLNQVKTITPTPTNDSYTAYPSNYSVSGTISGTNYKSSIGKPSSTTNTKNDYAKSSSANATITYSFDLSSIPSDATITDVTVKVGGHLENTSRSTATLQLYSGTNTKGNSSKFTTTSHQVITMPTSSWTRTELQQANLKFTIGYYGGLVSGVDFIVKYTVGGGGAPYQQYTITNISAAHTIRINLDAVETTDFRYKLNGQWVAVTKIYRKSGGTWIPIRQDDVVLIFNTSDPPKAVCKIINK